MTLSLSALSKIAGPVLAAAVGAGAAIATGNHSLDAKVENLVTQVQEMRTDVRFLKCVAGYLGDASAVVKCTAGFPKP